MSIYLDKVPERVLQACPLCGEKQITMMRGIVRDMETFEYRIAGDKGYSFCNCRNIFFTDYKNIDKRIYDEDYIKKYKTPNIKNIALKEIEKFWPILKKNKEDIKSFLEIGSIQDIILDFVKEQGVNAVGLDIIPRESNHDFILTDFEKLNHIDLTTKFDVIHASHIFEHFKSPGSELNKCKSILNKGGLLYVAMPNTRFINFSKGNPLLWDWHVQEHHIMWNITDWIEFVEEHGLKCVYKEHGLDMFKQADVRWFWKQDFKTVFKK